MFRTNVFVTSHPRKLYQEIMIRKLNTVLFLAFISLLLSFCTDDPIDSQPMDDADARSRYKPTAIAGDDLIIAIPTNTVSLDGSLSKPGLSSGSIKIYQWAKISGPDAFKIADPLSSKTTASNLVEGVYSFQLTVTDNYDIIGIDVVVITVSKDPSAVPISPVISSFTPATGTSGTPVVITGANFSTTLINNIVKFNGTKANVTAVSSTNLTAITPAGATTGNITVTINNQTATSAGVFTIPIPAASTTPGELYFEGNMDNVTVSGGSLNGWSGLTNTGYLDGFYFNNVGGSAFAFQEVRKDPLNTTKNVLYAQTVDDDPGRSGTTRAQMTLDLNLRLEVMHTTQRMYLNPDIAYLSNYPSNIRWFTLFEMWNLRDITQGGDPAGSSRMSLSLFKETGAGQPLYWHIAHEYMQPTEKVIWEQKATTARIPIGKWFTMDIYIKRGDVGTGKFKLVITEDGGQPVTVFDITNSNQYPGKPELYINQWQPFKLYTSDLIMDYMRTNNKTISVSYNDFKWYKN